MYKDRYVVRRNKTAAKEWQVVDTKSKEVVSESVHKYHASDEAFDLNLAQPDHPKHWLHLATTPNSGVSFT